MGLSICNTKIDSNGRELLEHGTALFPISCYEDDLLVSDVPWHWHDEFEVLYVTQGDVKVSVGKTKYTLKKGEGLFINSGILHSMQKGSEGESQIHSIVFHPRIVGSGVDSIYWHNYIQPVLSNPLLRQVLFNYSESWHKLAVDEIKKAWSTCLAEDAGYEFEIRTYLSSLILQLSQNNPTNVNRPSEKNIRDNERLKGMLQFIQKNFANKITVSMIAGAVLISESECMRCFRSTMSTSPIRYLKQFRLQKAAALLETTDDKIIDIGMNCGFSDISYFIKSFKNVYGLTPSVYQRGTLLENCHNNL